MGAKPPPAVGPTCSSSLSWSMSCCPTAMLSELRSSMADLGACDNWLGRHRLSLLLQQLGQRAAVTEAALGKLLVTFPAALGEDSLVALAQHIAVLRVSRPLGGDLTEGRIAAGTMQQLRAGVDAATAAATGLVELLATARGSCNSEQSWLVRLLDSDVGLLVLAGLSVLELWRLRPTCRALRCRAVQALAALPRPTSVGAAHSSDALTEIAAADSAATFGGFPGGPVAVVRKLPALSTSTIALDLSTMLWARASSAMAPPPVPGPHLCGRSAVRMPSGAVVAVGGGEFPGLLQPLRATSTMQIWVPPTSGGGGEGGGGGGSAWKSAVESPRPFFDAISAGLADGQLFIGGGIDARRPAAGNPPSPTDTTRADTWLLSADGLRWAELPPMITARWGAACGQLPSGKLVVAGGFALVQAPREPRRKEVAALAEAEIFDFGTNRWSALPPLQLGVGGMVTVGCVVGGRFIAFNGSDGSTAQVFEPAHQPIGYSGCNGHFEPGFTKSAWLPLSKPRLPARRGDDSRTVYDAGHPNFCATPVEGGLLAVRGTMLYDLPSDRWVPLPVPVESLPVRSTACHLLSTSARPCEDGRP